MTMKQLFRCFDGAATARRRARQQDLWTAWHIANFSNAKKLPDLGPLLRKLEPLENRVMSPRDVRQTILGMAEAMGAKITVRKKGEQIQ